MDRALLKLMRLRLRAVLRGMFRGLKTVRGALLFALGAVTFGLWLGPAAVMAAVSGERSDPETVRAVTPLILLGVCLLTLVTAGKQKCIYFSPAEVDFLFAGPFSRRELLAYKIAGGTVASLLIALFFSVLFLRHASCWVAGLVGYLAALVFVQLFSTAVLLVGQTVAEQVYTTARRLVLLGVLILAAVALAPVMSTVADGGLLALAAGQLVAPTAAMTAIHLVVLGVLVPLVREASSVLLVAAAFTVPFNFLLFGLENLMFLLFPWRMSAAMPGDLQRVGRSMVDLFVEIFVLALCCGAAAAVGGLAYLVCGGSSAAAVVAAWLTLAGAAVLIVPCVAWAYSRYDVSLHTPP